MNGNIHDKARQALALADASAVMAPARKWLFEHLEECPDCRTYAEAVSRTLQTLRSAPATADSALVQATQARVRSRALELSQQQERAFLVWISCLLIGLSVAVTTPVLWRFFSLLGLWSGLSTWAWRAVFAFFWMAPGLIASWMLLAHGTHLHHVKEGDWL